jgi:hypothetical protein
MITNLTVLALGLAVLATLAMVIGDAVDQRARDRAWRRIAAARRRNHEQRCGADTAGRCPHPDCPHRW